MLTGSINFENYPQMRLVGDELVDGGTSPLHIDLAGLTHANSLTVGAMIAWYRRAAKQDKIIRFDNVSEPLHKIIQVSGLQTVLLGAN